MTLAQARLSERNVVELVSKLQQLGFLGDGLLHSTSGKEYLTVEHLRRELLEAVDEAGGRESLVCRPSEVPCTVAGQLSAGSVHCQIIFISLVSTQLMKRLPVISIICA